MNSEELLEKIKEIIFSVPDEMYRYKQPDYCFDEDWEEGSPQEKAYLLIQELFIDENKKKQKNKSQVDSEIKVVNLGKCPTFFNVADENMFFNAIYSVPSYVEIKGEGQELFLFHLKSITLEEKTYLAGLFKRYGMEIPIEFSC